MKENILYIAPYFFEYHDIIKEKLSEKYHVTAFHLTPHSIPYKFTQIFHIDRLAERQVQTHYRRMLRYLDEKGISFNTIFIIKGSYIPDFFYDFLKTRYPDARYIQYLWDDIRIDRKSVETFRYFDKVLSFNPDDCRQYNLIFRPFFYMDDDRQITPYMQRENDMCCIWSYDNYRGVFLDKLNAELRDHKDITTHFHLKGSYLLYMLSYPTASKVKAHYHNYGLTYKQMIQLLLQSKSQIEIPHPMQGGLTTRPFESLSTSTKIITTNANIKDYDFYHPDNILVISRDNPKIDYDWLKIPYREIDSDIKRQYTLESFLNDILR